MRSSPLAAGGALAAALVLAACTSSVSGTASAPSTSSPGTSASTPTDPPAPPDGGGVPDVRVGAVPLPGNGTDDGGAALLAADGDGDVVAFLRELSAEGGDLSTVLTLGRLTPDGPGSDPDEASVLTEDEVPAVDDPVLVAVDPRTGGILVAGLIGEPGDDVRFGVLSLTDRATGVLIDAPALTASETVAAALSPDGGTLYLLTGAPDAAPVLLAVDPTDGAVLASVEVAAPGTSTPQALAAAGDEVVAVLDAGNGTPSAVLARWDADLSPLGTVALASDAATSSAVDVTLRPDGTAVAVLTTGTGAEPALRLVTVDGDDVTALELPGTSPTALAASGDLAAVAVLDGPAGAPTLLVVDLASGASTAVELCGGGTTDDVVLSDDGATAWVSGVCHNEDRDPTVWAVA
ncbi:hypothetical protein [Trujillonella endophytica]|uniref:Lactonase, 7-bladed beta-propeller n=1 Tax=Trujillonella endophytica TaxID=673521 RepID=A0A1H8VK44_9ACTN|nr:hypothetical protein [Trujillella endophytica]SEP15771.1 hypothetical protein SAMN05660991_03622 [Trujillella endophytica]